MKQFTFKLLSFTGMFMILLAIGIFTGFILLNNAGYYKISEKSEFVVLGHSHPECAFNDSLIYGLSNFSKSGESYLYIYLKAKQIILNNKQIKSVFIEFEIDKEMDNWTWDDKHIHRNFPRFFPLLEYSDFKFLWGKNSKAILNCPPKSFIKSIGYTFFNEFVIGKGIKSDNRFGGYVPLIRNKTDSIINNITINSNEEKINSKISETNIRYLEKIIALCKSNNVKVFLIRCPLHPKCKDYIDEIKYKEVLSSEFSNVEFLDFKDFPLKNEEFGDLQHLNYKGAKKFSIWFDGLLKNGIMKTGNKQAFINESIRTQTHDM